MPPANWEIPMKNQVPFPTLLCLLLSALPVIALLVPGVAAEVSGAAPRYQDGTEGPDGPVFVPVILSGVQSQPASEPAPMQGIWLSAGEINALSTSGSAWNNVLDWADDSITPNIADQNNDADAVAVAAALVWVRTGENSYRSKAINYIEEAMGSEAGSGILAVGRNVAGYVIAADLVGYQSSTFSAWLDDVRYEVFSGAGPALSIISCHEERPNNFGTHCGTSRIAIARYLGDQADLERAARVFKGWLGDRSAYVGFSFGSDLSWQCNPDQPTPINLSGCSINGYPADGILPDDQRRSGSFSWPPAKENYVWEALQGAIAQAWMLHRIGLPAFEWEQQALLRATDWLHEQAHFPAKGDDSATPWLINAMYGSSFPTEPATPGKNGLGFYNWTHSQ